VLNCSLHALPTLSHMQGYPADAPHRSAAAAADGAWSGHAAAEAGIRAAAKAAASIGIRIRRDEELINCVLLTPDVW